MTPTPTQIRALLDSATPRLTAYAAAPLAGLKPNQMQKAVKGDRALSAGAWQLLTIMVSARAREQLPAPIAP